MYNRGYVKSWYDAPMCHCIEDMPVVARADCSEVKLASNFHIAVNKFGVDIEMDGVYFEFQACQGYNKAVKTKNQAQNNDLRAKIERMYREKKIDKHLVENIDDKLVDACNTVKDYYYKQN